MKPCTKCGILHRTKEEQQRCDNRFNHVAPIAVIKANLDVWRKQKAAREFSRNFNRIQM